ncbi:uncharacterized protein LOC122947631 [Acropora millepora]|uniref:uncharacterized protein LOC122947631 n=1 Tax=Acropora millepora TaxID=45264 RepID=UPI001CF18934|nr:uncharacterized protein LOC122947631 [Acropora millepora]
MPVERALGVSWDTNSDCFVYGVVKRNIADTRRKMLSLIASLFDPIGFLAPFLVRAKILLQRMWQCGVGWDDVLPSELLEEWSQWQEELDGISQFRISRFYRHVPDSPSAIELHVFGDASEQAFCSVAYLRFCYASGAVKCAFVMAKTRVASKKPLSIPKLELQAAVLSARLSLVVIKEHDYIIDSTYFWTDSSTVFQWIRGVCKRHPAFIANRIGEILDSTDLRQWNHCPGLLNPADDGSRGLPVNSITSGSRWLNGPAFLLLPEEKWPKGNSTLETSKQYIDDPQTREIAVTCIDEVKDTKNQIEHFSPAKYSSLTKFLRGIVRAGGRIERADIPFCSRHPILLSPDHEFTRLIIMDCHERLKHEGVEHVRNELRQQYWILRCRATVRKILHRCSYYRRRKAKPVPPMMASLPSDRLQVAPAFSLKLAWISLDHLGRFIARRGKQTVIYSDNGTNFVGANRALRECIDDWNQDMIGR